MNKLPVSIIIPTYNEEEFLPRLLESISKQTQQPREIIVADAKSTDRTRVIAKKYGCKIVAGGKPAKGRNNGAKAASGKLLLFLDADVILPENFLTRLVEQFENRELDIAGCTFKPLSNRKDDVIMHKAVSWYYKIMEKKKPHVPGFCTLIKKQTHQRIGGWDETIFVSEDTDYSLRASQAGKFEFLTEPVMWVSVRRQERDGRLKLAWQYVNLEAYLYLRGRIRNNRFNYKFGGYASSAEAKDGTP